MMIPPIWKIFASFRIPGVGLGVFYFLFRDLVHDQNPWIVALAMILICLIAVITLLGFPRVEPRQPPDDHSDNGTTLGQHSGDNDK